MYKKGRVFRFKGLIYLLVCHWNHRRHSRYEFNIWVVTIPWRRKWQPTPVFLPGGSHGEKSLVGHRVGHNLETEHAHTRYWDSKPSQVLGACHSNLLLYVPLWVSWGKSASAGGSAGLLGRYSSVPCISSFVLDQKVWGETEQYEAHWTQSLSSVTPIYYL